MRVPGGNIFLKREIGPLCQAAAQSRQRGYLSRIQRSISWTPTSQSHCIPTPSLQVWHSSAKIQRRRPKHLTNRQIVFCANFVSCRVRRRLDRVDLKKRGEEASQRRVRQLVMRCDAMRLGLLLSFFLSICLSPSLFHSEKNKKKKKKKKIN